MRRTRTAGLAAVVSALLLLNGVCVCRMALQPRPLSSRAGHACCDNGGPQQHGAHQAPSSDSGSGTCPHCQHVVPIRSMAKNTSFHPASLPSVDAPPPVVFSGGARAIVATARDALHARAPDARHRTRVLLI